MWRDPIASHKSSRRSRGLVLGGLRLRWRTWRRAYDLDRRLAGGADPIESDELSLRVGQLGAARCRHRLARTLRWAVRVAEGQSEPLIGRALQRSQIRAHSALLRELVEALDGVQRLGVEGLAMASLLVNHAPSPMYHSGAPRSLSCEFARLRGARLVVLGSRGRRLGRSVARAVIRGAERPVLVAGARRPAAGRTMGVRRQANQC